MSGDQDQACVNLKWSLALLEGLVEGGMHGLVISPGSRSTPLILAGQRQPALELTVVVDERSAAFFALGAARASGQPVGLVCTSGSAPAHWLPAVIEASESEIPLILLSADRPPELRGWGANQTIDQTRLFDGHVRLFQDPGAPHDSPAGLKMIRALGLRAALTSLAPQPGPVHLNLPFREPLVPGADCAAFLERPIDAAKDVTDQAPPRDARHRAPDRLDSSEPLRQLEQPLASGRGLICCGPGVWSPESAEALWHCAERLSIPVLCDPLSGLRCGPSDSRRITRYDSFLRSPRARTELRPDWVLRFGRAPVSKTLLGWLASIPTILVDPSGRWSDPSHDVRWRIPAEPGRLCRWLAEMASTPSGTPETSAWLQHWMRLEERVDRLARDYLAQAPWCEAHLITELLDLLPEGEGLLCANSMPIRQLDTWSGHRETRLHIFGNRGASGIDGQTSTLAGLNAGGVLTTGLLGDLSFLHDLSGLQRIRGLERPCILINNGGGRIFDYLPQQGLADFELLWRTPIDVDLDRLTESFGLRHHRVTGGVDFSEALHAALRPDTAGGIIEVVVDGDLSRQVHQDFWAVLRNERSIRDQ